VIDTRLVFTQHALDMLVERRIERAWVELTIRTPDTAEPDPTRPGVTRAFRRIAERDGGILRVAYVSVGDIVRVLTVFFDRARRR
jgi:hypothetical protein